jgi:hypothetical protein
VKSVIAKRAVGIYPCMKVMSDGDLRLWFVEASFKAPAAGPFHDVDQQSKTQASPRVLTARPSPYEWSRLNFATYSAVVN